MTDAELAGDNPSQVEESRNVFVVNLRTLLNKQDVVKLQTLFFSEENQGLIVATGWDVVPNLCLCLTDKNNRKHPKLVDFCESALVHLAKYGNPKEILIGLLEQADSFKDDVKFKTLLHAIQTVLLRLPSKRYFSLETSLETLYAHILCLELPKEANLEGNEKKLLDCDSKILRIGDVISALLTFLKPFVMEIRPVSQCTEQLLTQRKLLVKYLLKLLSHPLVFLDLTVDVNGTKSLVRVMSETVVKYMAHMCADFHRAVIWMTEMVVHRRALVENSFDDEDFAGYRNDDTDLDLGLSCFVYLVHAEKMQASHFPSVLRAEFVLLANLPYISPLLKRPETSVAHKGVSLLSELLTCIPAKTASYYWLENDDFIQCVKSLTQIVVMCPRKEVRQSSLFLLPKILSKFDAKGAYMFINYLLNVSRHAGLTGFIIKLLKDEIDRNFQSVVQNEHFAASNLSKLFRMIFKLNDGAATDLLEHSDSIMASLNLIRYLVIRDKPTDNISGIWNQVAELGANYLNPLQTGIEMSRAHYKMELDGLNSTKPADSNSELSNTGSELMSVTVGGLPLPRLPVDQQLNIIHTALHSFDMMQSVVARVQEIIDSTPKNT